MTRRRYHDQYPLFGASPTPQPRYVTPEPKLLYQAVLMLRMKGHKVYRQGRHDHSVDGVRIHSAKLLIALARAAA